MLITTAFGPYFLHQNVAKFMPWEECAVIWRSKRLRRKNAFLPDLDLVAMSAGITLDYQHFKRVSFE